MKKFTLLTALFLIITGYSHAQLVFVQNGNILQNESTITHTEIDGNGNMDAHIFVKNQSNNSIQATLTVTALEEPVGGFIGYCGWGDNSCIPVRYGNPIERTTTIEAGQEINPDIEAMGIEGENVNIKAEYKLTYQGEVQKVVVHFVNGETFIFTSSTQEMNIQISNCELIYNFPSTVNRKVNFYNIMGSLVKTEFIHNESGVVDLSYLPKGVYIYSVVEENGILTSHKFVIR